MLLASYRSHRLLRALGAVTAVMMLVIVFSNWSDSAHADEEYPVVSGIEYHLNTGNNHSGNPVTYTSEDAEIVLQDPNRPGFEFGGWYSDASFETPSNSISAGSVGDKHFYAKWMYRVSYNSNNATSGVVPDSHTAVDESAAVLERNTGGLSRTGYIFVGWNTKADGTGESYSEGDTQLFASSVSLYAEWLAAPLNTRDGYFSVLRAGKSGEEPIRPIVDADNSTEAVEDGWIRTRKILFGKQKNSGSGSHTYGGYKVSAGYKTIGVDEIPSVLANPFVDSGNVWNAGMLAKQYLSDTTSLNQGEALLFAEDSVIPDTQFDTENGCVYYTNPTFHSDGCRNFFDLPDDGDDSLSSMAKIAGPTEDDGQPRADSVAGKNYAPFELALMSSRELEGVCTNPIGCGTYAGAYVQLPDYSYTQQQQSNRAYKAFPISLGDTMWYFGKRSGFEGWQNLYCAAYAEGKESCANDSSGSWLRTGDWGYRKSVFHLFGTGALRGKHTTVRYEGLRPAIRLKLADLLLSGDSENLSQLSATVTSTSDKRSLSLTYLDRAWGDVAGIAVGGDELSPDGDTEITRIEGSADVLTATLQPVDATGLGWKVIDTEVADDGRVAKSGKDVFDTSGLPAGKYRAYVWAYKAGSPTVGLTNVATAPMEFDLTVEPSTSLEITLDVHGETNKDIVLPTNGVNSSGSVGVEYAWRVQWKNGEVWERVPCNSAVNDTGDEHICSSWVAFSGVSSEGTSSGPNVDDPIAWAADLNLASNVTLRISPEYPLTKLGWLKAFATATSDDAGSKHQTADLIRSTGGIPFIGIKQHATAANAGSYVGYRMFQHTDNLESIGPFLTFDEVVEVDDPKPDLDWQKVTIAGTHFLDRMFNGSGLANMEKQSFDLLNVKTVGSYFLHSTFADTALSSLPSGSFGTNAITSNTTYFMNSTFAGTRLSSLPANSFGLDGFSSVGAYFMHSTFLGTNLSSLPALSFDTSGIATVGSYFLHSTFADTALSSLPSGSFGTNAITSNTTYFMNSTFAGTRLSSLPANSFGLDGFSSVGVYFMHSTFLGTNLSSLPAGSFDISRIATVGTQFMYSTFARNAFSSGPGLSARDIVRVVSTWNLVQAQLNKTEVFYRTFSGHTKANGQLLVADAPQIAMKIGSTLAGSQRYTFTDTELCTDSPYPELWGLSVECKAPSYDSLPFTGGFPWHLLIIALGGLLVALGLWMCLDRRVTCR